MKTINLPVLGPLVAIFLAHVSSAAIVGNYPADANTLVLLHFDQTAGTSVVTNYGSPQQFFILSNTNYNP